MAMAANPAYNGTFFPSLSQPKLPLCRRPSLLPLPSLSSCFTQPTSPFLCHAAEVSVSAPPASTHDANWVSVVPLTKLPKGERQLITHEGKEVLLLWYKDEVYAIENSSPAENGAYSQGFVNAQVTQDGCIVCPSSGSTFYLKNGELKEWFPANPLLRILSPALKNLTTYPVKIDSANIYINTEECADAVLGGQVQAEEDLLQMFLKEDAELVLGFTADNEIINGRAAMVGFSVLLFFELMSGEGFLKGIGFLDFLYQYLPGFPVLKY